ncbi:MAG: glycine cleavage system protein GcvH [Myxococcales bacterium]|nr:glycine cleavage system protein GcvH [Myxococcales bacterium]
MNVPGDLRFTKDHEWVRVQGDAAVIGVTDYAQDALGDVVFIELPEVGATFGAGDALGVVESVKAASDVYSPVSGEVLAVNETLVDAPETVNRDPYGEAWMVKIRLSNPAELDDLMDAAAYQALLDEIKK